MSLPGRLLEQISKLPKPEQARIKENYLNELAKIPFDLVTTNENIGYILKNVQDWAKKDIDLFCFKLFPHNHYNPFLILLAKNNPSSVLETGDLIKELDEFYFGRLNDFIRTASTNPNKEFVMAQQKGLFEDFKKELVERSIYNVSDEAAKLFVKDFDDFTGIFKDCGIFKAIKPINILDLKDPIEFYILPKTEDRIPYFANNRWSYLSRSGLLNDWGNFSKIMHSSKKEEKKYIKSGGIVAFSG